MKETLQLIAMIVGGSLVGWNSKNVWGIVGFILAVAGLVDLSLK